MISTRLIAFTFIFTICYLFSDIRLMAQNIPAHHTDSGYRNQYIDDPDKNFFDFLKMKYFGDEDWANHSDLAEEVPIQFVDLETISNASNDMMITWLGHSTFLIQYKNINILTDPIFSNRASPIPFMGPKRYIPHVIDYSQLPEIHYVIISHNHYDHLDNKAIKLLGDDPFYLVPLGLYDWFEKNGINANRVEELDWWNSKVFEQLTITAMPSQHWSARNLFDQRKTLWASWSFNYGAFKLWFAGDTGYNAVQFKEIGERSNGFDVSLIPIGGYLPRSFMSAYHVNPDEAIQIHQDIKSKLSIGMHWGTFPLTAEGPIDPKLELEKQLISHELPDQSFITMSVGETILVPNTVMQ